MLPSGPMSIHRLIIALQVLLLSALPAFADSLDGYPSLRESFDPGLQDKLELTLDRLGLSKAVDQGRLAVALVDISDPTDPSLAEVNGDEMIYAASLPKIAILLGAFVEIERGQMALDGPTRNSLNQMIRVSSNREATRMLERVGRQRLLDILQSDRFGLYDPAVGGGLWVGKPYGKSPAYKRDPIKNLSHGATAVQAARFYYLLETGQLVNPELSAEMKRMLGNPGINHKFVRGLKSVPGARVYRKSGSWRQWHADSAIVEHGPYKYIVVGLAQDPKGGKWLSRIIKPLHHLIVPTNMAKVPQ